VNYLASNGELLRLVSGFWDVHCVLRDLDAAALVGGAPPLASGGGLTVSVAIAAQVADEDLPTTMFSLRYHIFLIASALKKGSEIRFQNVKVRHVSYHDYTLNSRSASRFVE
jgi:hypothetical protein